MQQIDRISGTIRMSFLLLAIENLEKPTRLKFPTFFRITEKILAIGEGSLIGFMLEDFEALYDIGAFCFDPEAINLLEQEYKFLEMVENITRQRDNPLRANMAQQKIS